MFGHLTAEEFVNLIEGLDVATARRAHLDQCARCHATWKAMESAHADFASMETDIPEPDWSQFRSSVRDELLSRSVQRSSAVRRWTGWAIRPAMAWGLSMVMVFGVTTGLFLWRMENRPAAISRTVAATPAVTSPAAETAPIETEMSVWSQSGMFEELAQLGTIEEESLRKMLESAEQETSEQR